MVCAGQHSTEVNWGQQTPHPENHPLCLCDAISRVLSEKGERKLKENQQFVAHPCRTLYDNAVIFYQTIVTDRVQ